MSVEPTNAWSPDWSNAVFSLEERDARWAKVRKLMARDGVDLIVCLPCTNSHDRGQANARYLTQLGENSDETTVAFPIEGGVTAWHSRGGVWPSSNWFADIRPTPRGTGGATVSRWIEEDGRFANARIAICGMDSSPLVHIRSDEGEVNWQSVEILKARFPKASFVSGTPILGEARWQKSEAEIAFIKKGAEIAEITLDAVTASARPGVAERHVFARMMFANADAGGSFQPMVGWGSGPVGRPYHRLEQPSFRTINVGDLLTLEIEGRWGGYIAQIDQSFMIGQPPEELLYAWKKTIEAFDRVMDSMRPGVTIRELVEVANLTGLDGRLQTGLGLHGRGTGDDGPLVVALRPEPAKVLDLEVAEGCSFIIKPSVTMDGVGDYCRFGETVVVTRSGVERLGVRPKDLVVIV